MLTFEVTEPNGIKTHIDGIHHDLSFLETLACLDPFQHLHEYACGCFVMTAETPRYYDHACAACHRENWTSKSTRTSEVK